MKFILLFEDFKVNQITSDDIIDCIKKNGVIYSSIVKNLENHNPDEPLKPVSIDEQGLITIIEDGEEYEIDLKNVKKIEN
jgi:hypothetical protein